MEIQNIEKIKNITFKDLGVIDELCQICKDLGWKSPTEIQKEAVPVVFDGHDVIALAETGSGKTGAFAIPIIQSLLNEKSHQNVYAVVLTPTRELAIQIKEQFDLLGRKLGLKCCVVVGGMEFQSQRKELSKKPNIVVATPGRLVDHLHQTNLFNLNALKYFVMDEADRILDLGFEKEIGKIMDVLPKDRRTMLFSATMTSQVNKLQRAHLVNVVKVEVSTVFQTVKKLQQYMLAIPFRYKNEYLYHILKNIGGESVIIFCKNFRTTFKTTLILRHLGFTAIPLHGKMNQNKRIVSLNKFKSKQKSVLIATGVASRGLDIPNVDYVINFDVPHSSKEYIHRVGRTARAGRPGTAITLVSQYDVEYYQRLEKVIEMKLPVYPISNDEVLSEKAVMIEAERNSSIGIGVKPWYELTAPADLLPSGQFKHQPHITSLTVREMQSLMDGGKVKRTRDSEDEDGNLQHIKLVRKKKKIKKSN